MAEFEAILVRHPQSPTRTVKYIAVQPTAVHVEDWG